VASSPQADAAPNQLSGLLLVSPASSWTAAPRKKALAA